MANPNIPESNPKPAADAMHGLSLSSQAVHADDFMNNNTDVAPPIHVSTTFRYSSNPDELIPESELDPELPHEGHIYSRLTAPSTTRLEAILSTLLKGPSVTYSSGLSAFHALLVFLNPKRIALTDGYHGCHGVLGIHKKLTGIEILTLDAISENPSLLQKGDIIHVETPLNPYGTARDLSFYAKIAKDREAYLTVDATFAPPPLQDPFQYDVDIAMHSGTKYIGGHSDMLLGVLAIHPKHCTGGNNWIGKIKNERTYLGAVPGNLEAWLGVRSIRTLEIRVKRQSENATNLVRWLNAALHPEAATSVPDDASLSSGNMEAVRKVVKSIHHASLQVEDIGERGEGWLAKQMPNGYGPVFAIVMQSEEVAKRLPSLLGLFHHATSLGGVESLIEWRAMSDATVDRRLLRVSVGVEGWEDLRADLLAAFEKLAAIV